MQKRTAKELLIEYADMKEEIKDLRKRIDKNKRELQRLNESIVCDSVACGKKGKKPLRTVKVEGKPKRIIEQKERAIEKQTRRLEEMEVELLEMTTKAEEIIEGIQKSELRIMFRLYFIDDMTYRKVADIMNQMFPKRNIKYTDENVKKKIQRFFKMSHNVPKESDRV